ncbi:MAG: hypothetical protein ACRDJP_04405 [Actinomycetota bacterium]
MQITVKRWHGREDPRRVHRAPMAYVATALVGAPTVTALGEDESGWNVAVTADDTNDALAFDVTGDSADATRWVAMVQTAEVVF